MTRRRRRTSRRPAAPPDQGERVIRLMADYCAFPLWRREGGIGPDDLPLSTELVEALQRWADTFDQLPTSDFEWPSQAAHDAFVHEGHRLKWWLQNELGPEWTVEYAEGS